MKALEEELGKRQSLIHAQNVFLTNAINIYLDRQSQNYIIGYELKSYRTHYLLYKISKKLISEYKNPIKIKNTIDINVNEDYRLSIKKDDPNWEIKTKNVVVRITPTRYDNLKQLYGIIYRFGYRHTGQGGRDELDLKIPQCPVIANSTTINNICYKLISSQRSGQGTHGTNTYLILGKEQGEYEIGTWLKVSNSKGGRGQNSYEYPVSIKL